MKYPLFLCITITALITCISCGQSPTMSDPTTGIEGKMSLSPNRPGPIREGMSSTGPLPGVEFSVRKGDAEVASFTTDDQGRFKVSVPPGQYTVIRKAGKSRIGRFGPFEVEVAAGKMTKVEWTCDSGMR